MAEELDREKRFPYEIVAKLGGLGLMGIPYPEEYGGGGADNLSYALVVEELARVDSSVAITLAANTSLGTWPLYAFGSDEQKQKWMPRALCAASSSARFGLTEPEAGSDAGNTRTRASCDDGDWVINGAKQFITNSGTDISGFVTITARHRRRRDLEHARARTARRATRSASPTARWAGTPRTRARSASRTAACPRRTWSGQRGQGFKQFLQTLDGGRIGVAAHGRRPRPGRSRRGARVCEGAGGVRQVDLEVPGDPDEAGRSCPPRSRRRACSPTRPPSRRTPGSNFSLTAAQAKLKTGRLAVRATEEAVQIHGGYGYIEEYPVCRFYRDAKILTIGEGTDEVQQMVIARALGA